MSEIYKNTSQYVTLDIHGAEADAMPTATLVRGENAYPLDVEDLPEDDETVDYWRARIGLVHTQEEGDFKVVWEFSISDVEATKTDYFTVVKPYVTVGQAREELEIPAEVTDLQIIKAERKARHAINRYCKQSFGMTKEKVTVKGSGTYNINLPKRLMSAESIIRPDLNIPLQESMYQIRREGLVLRRWYGSETSGSTIILTNPIFNPYYDVKSDTFAGAGPVWHPNIEWEIDGTWGYEQVPGPVVESALLLIEQYLCPDDTYRERYITNMRAADYSYSLRGRAYHGTGNATADFLLQDYIWDSIWLV